MQSFASRRDSLTKYYFEWILDWVPCSLFVLCFYIKGLNEEMKIAVVDYVAESELRDHAVAQHSSCYGFNNGVKKADRLRLE